MDARRERARELADRGRVVKKDDHWLVFSLTSPEKYRVTLYPVSCTCPDFELRQEACKHVLAVRTDIAQKRSDALLGKPPREPVGGEPVQPPRKTYRQNWGAYDQAQANEKAEFLTLLADLCRGIAEPQRKPGPGRRPASLADQAFAACFKVFSGLSGRRFMTDLRDAREKGHVGETVSHSTIARCFEDKDSTPVLRNLLTWSSLPLAPLESVFAPDSSGFSACKFDRWFDAKYGRMHQEHSWVKVHTMTGALTNVVTAVEIHDKDAADNLQLPALVEATAVGFQIKEVPADKAYGTIDNYDAIAAVGATPYIAFRGSATGWSGGLWAKMYHMFCLRKDEFLRHYHPRSNVESTFSMAKRKFGDSVRSKTEVAMKNEVLAKFVCHNICCVIQSAYEFGIDPVFATESQDDSQFILKFRF
jgi:transposase